MGDTFVFGVIGGYGRIGTEVITTLKEGTYKGAGCFYLDEIVKVADFMSGLKHHELFAIKTETNL
ncbi:hypothetical protein [Desulfobacter vibrioformis]|uniref:hypothetical protein n=1 Tax=Desulfobacter vibrioformis TaxID=34031 RepID=UPI00054F7DC3|nr:hypothetical protein [Desulfobacter vibrioformis]